MKIDNLKELQKLIALCRKEGIDAIEIDNIKMNLGAAPIKVPTNSRSRKVSESVVNPTYTPGGITEDTKIETHGLTEDQLLFYSAQDHMPTDNQQ